MDPTQLERLRGKVTKDRADIIALLDPEPTKRFIKEDLDIDAFDDLVKRHNLEFTLTTITELPKYRDSTQLYNPTLNAKQIDEWIKTVLK